MRALLDTHVLLWYLSGDRSLGRRTRAILATPQTDVVFSVVSVWEIGVKASSGQVLLPEPWDRTLMQQIESSRFQILDLSLRHVLAIRGLPLIHRDPFDRMLLAQAASEDRVFFTSDSNNLSYPVRCHDARS